MKQQIKNSLAIASLFLLGLLYIWHFGASLHEVCPAAAVCAGPLCIEKGEVFFSSGMIFFAVIVVASVFFGRFFCGWLCPVGLLQKIIFSIRSHFFKKRFNYSHKIHLLFVFLKYSLSMILLVVIFYSGKMVTVDYCPVYLIAGFNVFGLVWPAVIVLAATVIGTLFIRRFFCRYLCPLSVFFEFSIWLGHKLNLSRELVRSHATCTNCKVCDKHCPAGIRVSEKKDGKTTFCLSCGECINRCPQNKKGKKTLHFTRYRITKS